MMNISVYFFDNGELIINAQLPKVREILKNEYKLSSSQISRLITARDKHEINGLYISTDGKYDDSIVQQKRKSNRNKRKKYNKIIYAFDIETSTYNVSKDRKLSIMYLGCIKGIKCNPYSITLDNYTDYITFDTFFRTYEELNNILVELNNESVKNNEYTYIYVHNLSYEFSFMQNLPFFKEHYNNDSMLATSGRKPISFDLDHLIFRCSYRLIGKSLNAIGESLGIEKLTEIKGGYNQHYLPCSTLPEEEYIYNSRDVDVTLLGVLDTFKNSNYYRDVYSIHKMLTATSLTRLENQLLTENTKIEEYTRRCTSLVSFYNELLPTNRIVYRLLRETFTGGYVRGNRHYLFKPLENVVSYDIASSYPAQMYMSRYPMNYKVITDHLLTRLLYYNKDNEEYISKFNGIVNWYMRKPNKTLPHYYIAKIQMSNVRVKKFENNNEMPLISISKCENIVNATVSNGRVLKSDSLNISITVFDYLIFKMFYDFDISDCYELLHTIQSNKLHEYVTNSLNHFSKQKVVFKRLLNGNIDDIDDESFYFENYKITTDSFTDSFFKLSNEEKEIALKRELKLSKNRLNAQYGINVQQLAPDELTFDVNQNIWTQTEKEEIDDFRLMRNYIVGIHITVYARMHLAIMTYLIFTKTQATVIYWDTDSLKIYNDLSNVQYQFNDFNKKIQRYWNCEKFYNMGLYDYEGIYSYFCTGGAKSYIFEKNKELTISISGVPKRTTSNYLNTIYNGDFVQFIKNYYHPNVVICSNITNKLSSSYYRGKDNIFKNEVLTDEQGNEYTFNGYSGCILIPSDFTITGTAWTDTSVVEECQTLSKMYKNGVSLKYTCIGTPSNIDDRLEIYNESEVKQ